MLRLGWTAAKRRRDRCARSGGRLRSYNYHEVRSITTTTRTTSTRTATTRTAGDNGEKPDLADGVGDDGGGGDGEKNDLADGVGCGLGLQWVVILSVVVAL